MEFFLEGGSANLIFIAGGILLRSGFVMLDVDPIPLDENSGISQPVVWGTRGLHPELPWFSPFPWFP